MGLQNYRAVAPSNIAFAKYWGKSCEECQWPANSSLSMTLSKASTTTTLTSVARGARDHRLIFQGKAIPLDSGPGAKVGKHLHMLQHEFQDDQSFDIVTDNSFPTGCGIASSASGMAALTIAALASVQRVGSLIDLVNSLEGGAQELVHLARLGSGSAGRSLFGGLVEWRRGDGPDTQTCSQVFAPDYWELNDTIVVLSTEEKSISSTEGHRLAWSSVFFEARLAVMEERIAAMRLAYKNRDLATLGALLEADSLEMHSIMATSKPPVRYLSESSFALLTELRAARRTAGLQAYFTIDAGENIHIVCEPKMQQRLISLLQNFRPDVTFIEDCIGKGPELNVF